MDEIGEILKGCVAGKHKAQEQLYRLYSRKMFGVCLYYTKDHSSAEDILQDGFIKVFENIKQFQNKGSLEGWIRRIMVNTALERFRKQHPMYVNAVPEDFTEDFSYNDVLDNISSNDLLKIIQELSSQYRIVFNLFAIEGYSHQEIATMLNISEGTSKSNLSRARKILQEKVEQQFHFSEKQKSAAC